MSKKVEWFLDILCMDLDSAEQKLRGTASLENIRDIRTILNLLAVYLLKHDYKSILDISNNVLKHQSRIPVENLIRIVEYKVIADLALGHYEDVVNALVITFIGSVAETLAP